MFKYLAFALILSAIPAAASDEQTPEDPPLFGDELGALGEMAEDWMRDLTTTLSPMMKELRALIDDLERYQAPEMLPNGDIIIRRKPDAPAADPSDRGIDL